MVHIRQHACRVVAALLACFGLVVAPASAAPAKPQAGAVEQQTTRVACVGDSITYGAGIRDRAANCYPAQLGRMLGEAWAVRNFGVNAATLLKKGDKPYWKQKAYRAALDWQPQVVVIKLGTNDTKPRNWKHKGDLAADCAALADSFALLPSRPRVWICLPVPAYPERWGIRDSVIRGELIPILRQVAKEKRLPVIDLYAALSGKKELFPDKIHPNRAGATLMAKEIHNALTGDSKAAAPAAFGGKKTLWHGHARFAFVVDGRRCIVVTPKTPAPGRPWIWRARFFGHEPQTDVALLKKGFHVVYMDVGGLFGAPKAVAHWDAFHRHLTGKHGLAARCALEGMSRGGLIVFNWASANADKVACIYADAPVCDIKSWPGGRGKGKGSRRDWLACLKAYGLTEEQALAYRKNPIDTLAPLAKAKVPVLCICGAADTVVPVAENAAIVEERYRKLGGPIEVVLKKGVGHHPHSLKDPAPIVAFILKHAGK